MWEATAFSWFEPRKIRPKSISLRKKRPEKEKYHRKVYLLEKRPEKEKYDRKVYLSEKAPRKRKIPPKSLSPRKSAQKKKNTTEKFISQKKRVHENLLKGFAHSPVTGRCNGKDMFGK